MCNIGRHGVSGGGSLIAVCTADLAACASVLDLIVHMYYGAALYRLLHGNHALIKHY